jgi:hypothetical protein
MAKLRKLGNLAQLLLQSHLRNRDQEFQSGLVKQRQMEMAEINDANRRGLADDQRKFALLGKGLADPGTMETFARTGTDIGVDPASFKPTDDRIMGQLGAKLGQAKREELPTDLGVEQQLAATPWAGNLAKDPRAVKQGMMVRDDRLGQLNEIDQYGLGLKGKEAFASAEGQGLGKESADAANAPAALQRDVTKFNTMAPLEVRKAGQIAGAQTSANLRTEGQFYTSQEGKALLDAKTQDALRRARAQNEGAAIVKAAEASARFMPNVLSLEQKWNQAQPEIARLVEGGILNGELMDILQARGVQALPLSIQQAMSPAVRQYFEMRGSYMPIFARVLSEVGNLAEQEQIRAAGLAPSGIDALNGGAAGAEKMARMKRLLVTMPDVQEAMFAAVNGRLDPAAREAMIQDIIGTDDVQAPVDPSSPVERLRRMRLGATGVAPQAAH